jgi:hypothetical protein
MSSRAARFFRRTNNFSFQLFSFSAFSAQPRRPRGVQQSGLEHQPDIKRNVHSRNQPAAPRAPQALNFFWSRRGGGKG